MLYMLQPAAAFGFKVLVIRVTIYFEDMVIRLVIFRVNAELIGACIYASVTTSTGV